MKLKFFYKCFILLLFLIPGGKILFAQLQVPGQPLGLNKHLKAAEVMYVLPPVDPMEIEAELELNRISNSKPLRFALERPVNLSPESHGAWSQGENMRSWYIHVISPGAYSLGLVFGKFKLQPGVKLFVYEPGGQEVKGAFTDANNKVSGILPVGHLPGDELIIEMQVPEGINDYGDLELHTISHAFLRTGFKSTTADCPAGEFGCSQICEIDVNCVEGDSWWRIKPSVVRIFTTTFYCTGVLINNTSYDGTPYILTAEHCLNSQYYADRTVFQFNYESAACFGEDGPLDMSISGADQLDHGDSIDFSLLRLSETPPAQFGVFYSGWDRSQFQTSSTATLHHPFGDVKKVSIDEQAPSIPAQPGDVPYSGLEDYHYYSFWWIKQWDTGSTEGGSSGSPLFNQARRVIGMLSGGNASCGDSIGYNVETDRVIFNPAPNYDDYFTQFGLAWDQEEDKGNALKTWLDPLNLDLQSLNGYNPTSSEAPKILSGSRFRIYPNPATDFFHIASREIPSGAAYYSIVNFSGAVLKRGLLDSEGRAEVSTSDLVSGLYIVTVADEAYQEHHKLLITGQ
jgi:lysyl endopeptidase